MAWLTLLLLCPAAAAPQAADAEFVERARPALAARCFRCHSGDDAEEGLRLDALRGDPATERAEWNAVRRRVRAGEMPPAGEPGLEPAERAALQGWLDEALGREPDATDARSVLRRLNRREYANTIRDLFGVSVDPAELPADDVGHGFDTVGEVLATSELLLDRYLRLAERVAERAVQIPDEVAPRRVRVEGQELDKPAGGGTRGAARSLARSGEAAVRIGVRADGEYALRARLAGDQAGDEPCRAALKLDGRELLRADVPERPPAGREVETVARIERGERKVAVAFLNDFWDPDNPDPKRRDRNLVVEWVEVEGPLDPPPASRWQRDELDPATRGGLRDVVTRLLRRAWRRPPARDEVQRVLDLAAAEEGFERRVRAAIVAALVSPQFLYRVEQDAEDGAPRALSDHELATRLACFLWSSTPDPKLDELCDAEMLHVEAILRAQVRRMLADARSQALAEGFAVQWLQLGRLDRAAPDPEAFPGFDDGLRASMRAEALLVFDAVLREGRPARDLLEPGFTFLDERLAAHYGVEGVRGPTLRRVPVDDGLRGGVLGLAAVLTATSYPTRTSPSARGKFVLEALLGAPPPPPPPGVGVLDDSARAAAEKSLRERLERHRADPACASCHARIDPLGFGLETLDATGRLRARDGRFEIETAGVLPDGRAFAGPAELQALVADDPAFVRGLVEKLVVYALGRGVRADDAAWIDALIARAGRAPTLAGLIEELALSAPFRTR